MLWDFYHPRKASFLQRGLAAFFDQVTTDGIAIVQVLMSYSEPLYWPSEATHLSRVYNPQIKVITTPRDRPEYNGKSSLC